MNYKLPFAGTTIWYFGRSGAGKTYAADKRWAEAGEKCIRLDGDHVRRGITNDCGYDKAGIEKNIKRIVSLCKLLNEQKFDVIASFITPFDYLREYISNTLLFPELVYVHTPYDVCYERRKELYDTKDVVEFEEPTELSNYEFITVKGYYNVTEEDDNRYGPRSVRYISCGWDTDTAGNTSVR